MLHRLTEIQVSVAIGYSAFASAKCRFLRSVGATQELQKLRKKLREVERIEERLKANEKVDPLQLPKLDRKTDILSEIIQACQCANTFGSNLMSPMA